MTFNVFLTGLLAATAAALPQGNYARSGESGAVEARDSGSGGIQIVNNLGTDVYLWTTSSDPGSMKTLSAGSDYSEDWTTNSNGGGISIKMSTTQSKDSVLQFEYTQDDDKFFWDMSSIDLDETSEFIKGGFTAKPSDSSCRSASCAAGDANCAESYQHPDDVNTYSCSKDSSFTLTLG
ncbi:uncharacterized protein N7515_002491 [Penicillium bovifimosum]|uniref:Uncharacterized protein n=1 Tax=Penicillium bovifimosum TaxID=126998 RepID=A0A9W9HC23_9EURO|nr:uncharacterized protein N7515_002491 [Penicillium bovifimosum]KAJ5143704.1 hypothetical protein N7515_002491 [Penicillium bovifimosum]